MLASMRLCANVPAQHAIQTALGGYQSIDDLVAPGGRMCRQRDLAHATDHRHSRRQLRQAQGGAVHVSAPRPGIYPIDNDQDFIAELLQEERVLLVQGSGFNWPAPDHFRLVFLPL
jgi:alanine-synthesizing transaminase